MNGYKQVAVQTITTPSTIDGGGGGFGGDDDDGDERLRTVIPAEGISFVVYAGGYNDRGKSG